MLEIGCYDKTGCCDSIGCYHKTGRSDSIGCYDTTGLFVLFYFDAEH